jgi:formate-dependent nitrite reductase membrane component NrfD
MNLFVADPEWGWWIVLYFFLGGIAAGCYFVATIVDLIGDEGDRRLAGIGFTVAFPLIALCGIFLILDLERPERFWHMLLQSEVVHQALDEGWPWSGSSWELMVQAPMLKHWSPMSIGAWALALFGVCSMLSLVGNLLPERRPWRWLKKPWIRWPFQLFGCGVGFFVAAYTGALLTATNQPLWSQSEWIAALFLTSAASTGLAVFMLASGWLGDVDDATVVRLQRADLWALALELIVFVLFLASLTVTLEPVLHTVHGQVFVFGTLIFGLLLPLALHLLPGPSKPRATLAALATLLGGFLLRWGIVLAPGELLTQAPSLPAVAWDESLWSTTAGKIFLAAAILLALVVPLLVAQRLQWPAPRKWSALAVAVAVLAVVGFYTITPARQLQEWEVIGWSGFSPEDGRLRGGGEGASISNRSQNLRLRTKFEAMTAQ